MSESIRIGRVVHVGDPIDGSARNTANSAFFGRVDCNGSEIDVILKIELPHRLAKELIATSLASRVGIQHSPGLIGVLDPADLNRLGGAQPVKGEAGYLCFASEKRLGSTIKTEYDSFLTSPFALELLVFDQLIGNFDRVYGNILEHEGDYWAFDHDKILFLDEPCWSDLPVSQTVCDIVGTNTVFHQANNLGHAKKIADSFNAKISSAPLEFLTTIANIGLLSADDATALITYLAERAAALPLIVEDFFKKHGP